MAAYYINIRTWEHSVLQDTAQPGATGKIRDSKGSAEEPGSTQHHVDPVPLRPAAGRLLEQCLTGVYTPSFTLPSASQG